MDDTAKSEITARLTELVIDLVPDATLRAMYGGTVIELVKADPKSRIGGFYPYADYVSVEFAKGVVFNDTDGVLEGSGKLRRHVKLRTIGDIEAKGCRDLLQQAVAISLS
mgnify:CR=1 FL=1